MKAHNNIFVFRQNPICKDLKQCVDPTSPLPHLVPFSPISYFDKKTANNQFRLDSVDFLVKCRVHTITMNNNILFKWL